MRAYLIAVLLGCIASFTLCSLAIARVNVEQGRAMLEKQEYWTALELFASCLQDSHQAEKNKHADCLYLGEKAAVAVMLSIQRSGCENSDLLRFEQLGLQPIRNVKYAGCLYDYDFFKKLRARFPNSRYRDEVELLFRADCNVYVPLGWRNCERADLEYIQSFPDSPFAVVAKLSLARLYDNLWELLSEPDGPIDLVGTGNPAEDAAMAEQARYKALLLYDEILQLESVQISDTDYRRSATRYAQLQAKIPGNVFYALSIH